MVLDGSFRFASSTLRGLPGIVQRSQGKEMVNNPDSPGTEVLIHPLLYQSLTCYNYWAVVEPTLKNMTSSIGMIMTFPTEWEHMGK